MENSEKILEQALAELENGNPPSEILRKHPGREAELEEILSLTEDISALKGIAVPERALLARILSRLPEKDPKPRFQFLRLLAVPFSAAAMFALFLGVKAIYYGQPNPGEEIGKIVLEETRTESALVGESESDLQLLASENQLARDFSKIINEDEY